METHQFQAETSRLLSLVIHSLYTNRDIFLRELIANASDALDRLRFEALERPELLGDAPLGISLEVDSAARTLTIRDNGIGMSRAEVVSNIGTLARSGTKDLLDQIKRERATVSAPEMIGQFGVGFYSSFMVADKVSLTTRRVGEATGTLWESEGGADYRVAELPDARVGTAVTLQLKPVDVENGIEDYTDRWVLTRIVKQYADFVTYAIAYHGRVEALDGTVQPPGESASPLVLNSMQPLWTRPESEVTAEEFTEFYKHLAHDWTEPLLRISGKADAGLSEYAVLLFIPGQAPHDLRYHGYRYGVQLFARRMLIVDRCEEVIPAYLRFVRGVLDVGDIPLNVSRQSLQDSHHLPRIRKWLARKVLDALIKLRDNEPERYLQCWTQFGRVLKEGISEDSSNRDRLLPLLLFQSSGDPSKLTTLADYISRMKPDQKHIHYLTGETRLAVERSPHLEQCLARGHEVLFLTETVDELLVQSLGDVDGRPLRSVAKGKVDLGDDGDRDEAERVTAKYSEDMAGLLAFLEGHFTSRIRSVRISQRLTTSAACLTGEDHDYSPQLERLLLKGRGVGVAQKRILELNPIHPVIAKMQALFLIDPNDPRLATSADLLYGYAALAEGTEIADPVTFNSRLAETLVHALDVPLPQKGPDLAESPTP